MTRSDSILVDQAKAGDRAAVDELLRRHTATVRRMLHQLVGPIPELEDLQQIVLLRVVSAIPRFRGEASFTTWLYGICSNVARDHWRSTRTHAAVTPNAKVEGRSARAAPDVAAAARERWVHAGRALDMLSDAHRTALVLHTVLGHSVRETADLMESAESTTRLRLYYARKAFDRAMAQVSAGFDSLRGPGRPAATSLPSPRSDPRFAGYARFAGCDTYNTPFDAKADELECAETPLGRVQIWTRSGRVLCTRYAGHIGPDLALSFTQRAERVIQQHGQVITFHDWTAVSSFEPEVPQIFVNWTRAIGPRNPAIHLLFRSKMVRIAVNLASLVLGQIHAYSEVDAFNRALQRVGKLYAPMAQGSPCTPDDQHTPPLLRLLPAA